MKVSQRSIDFAPSSLEVVEASPEDLCMVVRFLLDLYRDLTPTIKGGVNFRHSCLGVLFDDEPTERNTVRGGHIGTEKTSYCVIAKLVGDGHYTFVFTGGPDTRPVLQARLLRRYDLAPHSY